MLRIEVKKIPKGVNENRTNPLESSKSNIYFQKAFASGDLIICCSLCFTHIQHIWTLFYHCVKSRVSCLSLCWFKQLSLALHFQLHLYLWFSVTTARCFLDTNIKKTLFSNTKKNSIHAISSPNQLIQICGSNVILGMFAVAGTLQWIIFYCTDILLCLMLNYNLNFHCRPVME